MPVSQDALPSSEVDSASGSPSKRRWVVLTLLFVITVINFIDRQTLSVLEPVIRSTFHLTNEHYGRIVAALQCGMMSGEFPIGWLMDRWGRLAVLWWSSATGSQIFARSGFQLGLTRFWMGTGECGNYSGGLKTVTRLFSKKDRTLAIGIFNSGSMVGATVVPPLIVYLLQRYGFRTAFLVPALLFFLGYSVVDGLWPRASSGRGRYAAECIHQRIAAKVIHVDSDAMPLLYRTSDAVLLVLDSKLSFQCASYDVDADRLAGLDSLLPR